ncbi:hypothetical protein NW754_004097 [Fusarium falciforme]|nr:hypothetical protein NW754_004097 [Fusarium falciforme]
MTLLPREGFTVDFVAKLARTTVLNPLITIPLAVSSFGLSIPSSTGSDWSQPLEAARPYTCSLAALSALLYATDFLNRQFNNNRTTDPAWDWDNEIVVITGGSSGIGAHLAQKLHARNPKTKVVIIDYVPLTWRPIEGACTKYYQCDLSDSSQIRAISKTLWSGYGKTIFMPGIMRYVAILKGGPEWLWRLAREATGNTQVDFRGRQKLDPKTGALLQT